MTAGTATTGVRTHVARRTPLSPPHRTRAGPWASSAIDGLAPTAPVTARPTFHAAISAAVTSAGAVLATRRAAVRVDCEAGVVSTMAWAAKRVDRSVARLVATSVRPASGNEARPTTI